MLPELIRRPMPEWLMVASLGSDALPIDEILRSSVFYPASAMDGRPVRYLAGFSHSFVYADCNVSRDVLAACRTFIEITRHSGHAI